MLKRKSIITMVIMVFVLLLCAGSAYAYAKNLWGIRGVYYEPIDEKVISTVIPENVSACYITSWLYYDGRVYTHIKGSEGKAIEYIKTENFLDTCYIYKSYFLSTDVEMLAGNHGERKIYALDGFDKKDRIAVVDEENKIVRYYEHMNDIWLKYGKDLLQDKWKLSENVKLSIKNSSQNLSDYELPMEEASYLFGLLCDANFLDASKELKESLDSQTVKMEVTLQREDESAEICYLYQNDYAVIPTGEHAFIMQLPEGTVDSYYNMLQEYNTVDWTGTYVGTFYTYDVKTEGDYEKFRPRIEIEDEGNKYNIYLQYAISSGRVVETGASMGAPISSYSYGPMKVEKNTANRGFTYETIHALNPEAGVALYVELRYENEDSISFRYAKERYMLDSQEFYTLNRLVEYTP